jgi:hypothetical protein
VVARHGFVQWWRLDAHRTRARARARARAQALFSTPLLRLPGCPDAPRRSTTCAPRRAHGSSAPRSFNEHQVQAMRSTFCLRVQFCDKHWKLSIRWRILYFARTRKGVDGHTILVQDIPGTLQGTVMGRVYDVRAPAATCASSAWSLT